MSKKIAGDNTFVKITNKDIYDKLNEVCEHVQRTNGKVKMNNVTAKAALVLSLIALTILTGINLVPLVI